MIYCPRCAAEAEDTQHYCRHCGVNLALVAKAVSLGDTINRSGNRTLPDLAALVGNLKLDRVSEDVGRAIERISREIEHSVSVKGPGVMSAMKGAPKTPKPPKDRRAGLIEQGAGAAAFGFVFTFILYFYAGAILSRIPPETLARLPFDILAWAPLLWLLGLFPLLGGIGNLLAGVLMPATALPPAPPPALLEPPPTVTTAPFERPEPASVTEHTTRTLDPNARAQ